MGSSPSDTLLAGRQTHLDALADSAPNEDHAAGDEGDDDREAAAHTESRDERDGLRALRRCVRASAEAAECIRNDLIEVEGVETLECPRVSNIPRGHGRLARLNLDAVDAVEDQAGGA